MSSFEICTSCWAWNWGYLDFDACSRCLDFFELFFPNLRWQIKFDRIKAELLEVL